MIEIDITYDCNLFCHNCNRSSAQAPEKLHMPIEMIRTFVSTSISKNKQWKRIRVLGGEPTLHPHFLDILEELRRYKNWYQPCLLEVVTNGYGTKVTNILRQIPKDIWIENAQKKSRVQTSFGPFNLAPIDDKKYYLSEYANGCAIMEECGMGLTPMGYYPCAVSGGIDRIVESKIGYLDMPDDADDMLTLARELCQYCGRFRDGHYVPKNIRPEITEQLTSPSWNRLYQAWLQRKKANKC